MRTLRGGSPKSRSHNVYQLNVIRDGQKKAVVVVSGVFVSSWLLL